MKYIISENKMINLVDSLLKTSFPKFNKKCRIVKKEDWKSSSLKNHYINPSPDELEDDLYAVYEKGIKELCLNRKIFDRLDAYLGEKLMEYVIDWFNKEFSEDAEYVTFFN